jgi:hypothetical protein
MSPPRPFSVPRGSPSPFALPTSEMMNCYVSSSSSSPPTDPNQPSPFARTIDTKTNDNDPTSNEGKKIDGSRFHSNSRGIRHRFLDDGMPNLFDSSASDSR